MEHLVQYFYDTAWYSGSFFNMQSTCCPSDLNCLHAELGFDVMWHDRSMGLLHFTFACFKFAFYSYFFFSFNICIIKWKFGLHFLMLTVTLFSWGSFLYFFISFCLVFVFLFILSSTLVFLNVLDLLKLIV